MVEWAANADGSSIFYIFYSTTQEPLLDWFISHNIQNNI